MQNVKFEEIASGTEIVATLAITVVTVPGSKTNKFEMRVNYSSGGTFESHRGTAPTTINTQSLPDGTYHIVLIALMDDGSSVFEQSATMGIHRKPPPLLKLPPVITDAVMPFIAMGFMCGTVLLLLKMWLSGRS